ncbi:hypothetical protein ACLMJK_002852 [Lecanora helva]
MALSQAPLDWASHFCEGASSYFNGNKPSLATSKTAIQNVTIWDGEKHIDDTTVVIDDNKISLGGSTVGANIVDGNGGFLFPGFIDTHVHASSADGLTCLANYGITMAYDMGTFNENMLQWRDVGDQGLTSLLFSGGATCKNTSFPCSLPGYPPDAFVTDHDMAKAFVQNRVAQGADYIKIVISDDDDPIPKEEYEKTIKEVADQNNRHLVSHAATYPAQKVARDVGGKFITHLPKDKTLTRQDIQEMLDKEQVAIPTLIMMQNLIRILRLDPRNLRKIKYDFSRDSVSLMYKMGVPILVGTDATARLFDILVLVPYGKTYHEELQLLQEAGMSTEDIYRGATSLPAKYFGLSNRGMIADGMRADLMLLDADPFKDIKNSDRIIGMWTSGTPLKGPFGRWAKRCKV